MITSSFGSGKLRQASSFLTGAKTPTRAIPRLLDLEAPIYDTVDSEEEGGKELEDFIDGDVWQLQG
jgi:hypothetical protein